MNKLERLERWLGTYSYVVLVVPMVLALYLIAFGTIYMGYEQQRANSITVVPAGPASVARAAVGDWCPEGCIADPMTNVAWR